MPWKEFQLIFIHCNFPFNIPYENVVKKVPFLVDRGADGAVVVQKLALGYLATGQIIKLDNQNKTEDKCAVNWKKV